MSEGIVIEIFFGGIDILAFWLLAFVLGIQSCLVADPNLRTALRALHDGMMQRVGIVECVLSAWPKLSKAAYAVVLPVFAVGATDLAHLGIPS